MNQQYTKEPMDSDDYDLQQVFQKYQQEQNLDDMAHHISKILVLVHQMDAVPFQTVCGRALHRNGAGVVHT